MAIIQDTHLFSPLTIRDITFRNRIAVSPMCMYSCENGFANDWHLVHLGARASGGAGLVIAEATAIIPEGRISKHDLGLWDDAHIEPLARVTRFIKEQGSVAGIQLGHAGRKASTRRPWDAQAGKPVLSDEPGGWQTVAPSPLPFAEAFPVPTELTQTAIADLVQAFADGTKRSLQAGFEVVEIHAAHGYLLHQFLSPLSNKRTDHYGGDFKNRTRFLLEVVQATRTVWPERLPLLVRVSATDWVEGGWDTEQTVELARVLHTLGVDLLDCSSGGAVPKASIPVGPGYQTPFAARVKAESPLLSGAVGAITSPTQADHIIRTGQADMVFIARELLRDPHFPLRAARELGQPIPTPPQYARAF